VATPTTVRPGRIIGALLVLIALVFGLIFVTAPDTIGKDHLSLATKFSPRLGLDLEGGTSVILTPRVAKGSQGKITKDALTQAVSIIRSRVDSFGVAEAEVATEGNNIVISVPGKQDKNILDTVKKTAQLRFRRVLLSGSGAPAAATPTPSPSGSASPSASGSPSPSASATASPKKKKSKNQNSVIPRAFKATSTSPSASSSAKPSATPTAAATPSPAPSTAAPAASGIGVVPITGALQQQFAALDCAQKAKVQKELQQPGADAPKKTLVTCSDDGAEKYILGPSVVLGTEVKSASAGLAQSSQGVSTGGWEVNLSFNGTGRKLFGNVTREMVTQTGDLNRFAIVLDGLVVSAPTTQGAITDGNAQITGSFTQAEATNLANVLKYGALPLTFDAGDVEQISATLGGDQLRAGLTAGVIGLLLVVFYSLLYYRGLGFVTVASLCVSAMLTYGMVVLLGWQLGFRLSLAGVAGLIVAIGITADSFIVFFERLRDEVREGRTLRVAVENGWVRARRTILAADFVSFLAAVILYILSAGSVRGFAFTLGLTTLIDIVVVFMFTKPTLTLLAQTEFFGQGHRFSGLDPERLGSTRRTLLTPAPRRRGGSPTSPVTEA
jgi:preprotein translocase subunit SecD